MKHTDAEIEDAAHRFEQLTDNLDPASVAPEDLSDLRAVAEAAEHAACRHVRRNRRWRRGLRGRRRS